MFFSMTFAPDGRTLVTTNGAARECGTARIWEVASGRERLRLEDSGSKQVSPRVFYQHICSAYSPDGRTVVMGMGRLHRLNLGHHRSASP